MVAELRALGAPVAVSGGPEQGTWADCRGISSRMAWDGSAPSPDNAIPARILWRADRMRHGKAYWVRLLQKRAPAAFGEIEAVAGGSHARDNHDGESAGILAGTQRAAVRSGEAPVPDGRRGESHLPAAEGGRTRMGRVAARRRTGLADASQMVRDHPRPRKEGRSGGTDQRGAAPAVRAGSGDQVRQRGGQQALAAGGGVVPERVEAPQSGPLPAREGQRTRGTRWRPFAI